MPSTITFPINPFEDVQPANFNKLNKKNVTEDFVEENFRKLKWDVLKPFNDTGIDRIAIKTVCPKGHTRIDENIQGMRCDTCKSTGLEIIRFLQIKTRSLKNNIFGFTLAPKDIRVDPRHVYVFYSDKTTEKKQDFLIVPVEEYLNFFVKAKLNPFASTPFRKGNGKLNSLRYDVQKDKWSWGKYSWELFRNEKGLLMTQSPKIDLQLAHSIARTRKLADFLQKTFSGGDTYSKDVETLINADLKSKSKLYANGKEIVKLRATVDAYLKTNTDAEILESSRRYFEFMKSLSAAGGKSES